MFAKLKKPMPATICMNGTFFDEHAQQLADRRRLLLRVRDRGILARRGERQEREHRCDHREHRSRAEVAGRAAAAGEVRDEARREDS